MSSSPVCSCLSCPAHPNGPRTGSGRPSTCGFYPSSSMTDAQWALIEPLLPPPGNTAGRGGRPEAHPRRRVLDAIFYLVAGGIAWAALPREYPPHQTVYGIFQRWVKAGAWQQVHDALRDQTRLRANRAPAPTAAIVDSQSGRGADTVPQPWLSRRQSCRAGGYAGFAASGGCSGSSAGVRPVRGPA